MSRIFSGIQPSGELHIGNYLGAVKNWVRLQNEYEAIFCIVDYHAITVAYDPDVLRERRRDMAIGLLAAGLDPNVCSLFAQSAVPEHTELAWFFNTITPLGELERQTQFKEKSAKQESINAGLLNYPVLQGLGRDDVTDSLGPILGLPTTLVIGRDGRICAAHAGMTSKETFENQIKELL